MNGTTPQQLCHTRKNAKILLPNTQLSTLKMGCFNPTLGQIWTSPAIGLHFLITFLTQHLGLSTFDPKLVLNNPAFFRVYVICDLYTWSQVILYHYNKIHQYFWSMTSTLLLM